jgi:hypothetical protein
MKGGPDGPPFPMADHILAELTLLVRAQYRKSEIKRRV